MSRTLLIIIGIIAILAGILAYISPDLITSIKEALGSWNAIVKIVIGLVIVLVAVYDKK